LPALVGFTPQKEIDMNVYTLDVAFKASPSSTFLTRELGLPSTLGRDVIAEVGKKSVRVRKAKSPDEAREIAQELQTAFEAHALPADVEQRLKKSLP
jgi:hypothetical protein